MPPVGVMDRGDRCGVLPKWLDNAEIGYAAAHN